MKKLIISLVINICFLAGGIHAQSCCSAYAGIDTSICCNDRQIQLNGSGTCNCSDTIIIGSDTTIHHCRTLLYSWSPSSSLSNPNIANPIASPTVSTIYVLTTYCCDTANRDTCCFARDSVLISVLDTCCPKCCSASAGDDQVICCSDGAISVTLNGKGTCNCSDTIINEGDTTIIHCSTILYSWSPAATLSNPNIANPVATPFITTVYTLTTYCYDPVTRDTCCTASDTVRVTVNNTCCRIGGAVNDFGISMYPNPASGKVSLEINQEITDGKITLFDNLGRVILVQKLNNAKGMIDLDISNIDKGSYLVQVNSGSAVIYSNNLIIK